MFQINSQLNDLISACVQKSYLYDKHIRGDPPVKVLTPKFGDQMVVIGFKLSCNCAIVNLSHVTFPSALEIGHC